MNPLSPVVSEYLFACGLSQKTIAHCTRSTRLFHDLDIYGEVAETCVETLASKYGVDLKGFVFEKYFPEEFSSGSAFKSFLVWIIPFAKQYMHNHSKYEEINIEMIERALHTKRWSDAQSVSKA
jgi:Protein of unknown function (DUF1493)